MAAPRADTYSALSGETVQGGRFPFGGVYGAPRLDGLSVGGGLAPNQSALAGALDLSSLACGGYLEGEEIVPNDVAANVWTPTKNASGYIKNGSWANLPANSWCRVAGTKLSQLLAPLASAGYVPSADDYGNGKDITTTFIAWSSGVLIGSEYINGLGGGHYDSSNNGLWRLNLEKMGGNAGWEIEAMPSDPDASGAAWSATYKDTRTNGGSSFTEYRPSTGGDGYYHDILPDGRPTARHCYQGVWYDSLRNEIGFSRTSKWTWNRTTQQWARSRWTLNGSLQLPTINSWLEYIPQNDEVVGHYADSDTDYYTWQRHAAAGANRVGSAAPQYYGAYVENTQTRINATELLMLWWDYTTTNTQRWAIYNSVARTWTGGAVTSPWQAPSSTLQEMQPMVYIPAWNKCLMRGTDGSARGAWRAFNLATKANEAYSPAGNAPPIAGYPGRAYMLYQRANGDQIVVAIAPQNDTTDCVYVMRCTA